MNRVLWRLVGILLVGLLPLLGGCQPIQAPAEVAMMSSADILREPYYGDQAYLVSSPLPVDTAAELSGYVNPEVLVSTEWLATNLNNTNLRLVDVRRSTGAADYAVAHIPGAQHVDLMMDLMMSDDPYRIAADLTGPEQFAALMSRLGVSNESTVVVYDSDGGTAAATLWWALRYFGQEDVRMLNGGLVKWILEGREVTDMVPVFEPTEYRAVPQPQLLATAEDVMQAIADPTVFLVDARPPEYYTGDTCHDWSATRGHVPTALNLCARWQLHPEYRTILPADQLGVTLAMMGISPEQRGITYCGNGQLAAFDAFLLYLMGFENVAVYDSSWQEWGATPNAPTETDTLEWEIM